MLKYKDMYKIRLCWMISAMTAKDASKIVQEVL